MASAISVGYSNYLWSGAARPLFSFLYLGRRKKGSGEPASYIIFVLQIPPTDPQFLGVDNWLHVDGKIPQ